LNHRRPDGFRAKQQRPRKARNEAPMTTHTTEATNAAEREFLSLLAQVKPEEFLDVLKALADIAQQHQA